MKKFFDDRIYYDPKNDTIWIGRPDHKTRGEPWTFWFKTESTHLKRVGGPPEHFIEIDRQPEMSLCGL